MFARGLRQSKLRPAVSCRARLATAAAAARASAPANTSGYKLTLQPLPGFTRAPSVTDMIFGRSTMPQVPLNLPAFTVPQQPETNVSGEVRESTLSNGVRVVTRDFHAPVASIGVFVGAGSRDESSETSGVTHFLETAAFATTKTRTDFRLIRDTSRMGATLSVTAGRESIAYTGEVLANWTRPVVETLADLIKRPMFIDFELRDLVNHYRELAEEREHKHDVNLLEHVHGAAYGYTGLGSPLYAPLANLQSFKRPDVLKQHVASFFTADRISVAAVGVPHDVALELAEQEFGELNAGVVSPKREAAQYVGGDVRMHASAIQHSPYDKKNTHVAFAWKGESCNSKDVMVMTVLNALLGDKPFLAGAPQPTRAVQSRLNTRIVANGLASSASAFTSIYSDASLFGVYAVCKPSAAAATADAILKEATGLSIGSNVSADELHRAKQNVKHAILYGLDSRSALLSAIGNQLTSRTGAVVTPQQWAAQVDQVSADDVARVAGKMLKTPLTVAASGDLSKLPRYDQLAAKLQ